MPRYAVNVSHLLDTTGDLLTLTVAAGRKIVIEEVLFSTHAPNDAFLDASPRPRLAVAPSSGGISPGVSYSIEPLDPDSPASTTLAEGEWSTTPTDTGGAWLNLVGHRTGEAANWFAREVDTEHISARDGEKISIYTFFLSPLITGEILVIFREE